MNNINKDLKIAIYTADSPLKKPKKLIQEMYTGLIDGRGLARRLIIRDFSALYRQTILGFLWLLIPPIITALLWIFLNYSQIVVVQDTGIPYPLFVLSGTIFWQLFVDAINAPLLQLSNNKSMLTKVQFPKESLIMAGVGTVLINFIIKISPLFVLILLFQISIQWTVIFCIVPLSALFIFGYMLGIYLVPFGLLYKDIQQGILVILPLLMYLAPVVYPVGNEGILNEIIGLNPLTPLLLSARDCIFTGISDYLFISLIYLCLFIVGFIIAWVIYHVSFPFLVERMES